MGCVVPGADGGGSRGGVGTEGCRLCSRWRRILGWGGGQRAAFVVVVLDLDIPLAAAS
jgi:hypothetical protein